MCVILRDRSRQTPYRLKHEPLRVEAASPPIFVAPAPTTPDIEVGNATTLPAPVPEPEETTPLQDYATYEATKDISDPNTAAVAGAAAAQVAGALQ